MVRNFAIQFIEILAQLLIFAIFARVILSWFRTGSRGVITRFIIEVTEPVLGFFRRIIPPLGMFDLSPLVAFFAIHLARNLLLRLLS